ncbi:hypothetical protein QYE76_054220 [Lolium multiflorum]|uniref:Uncharacterized protein n=1 Tax=Lolium multiflorum TaxID=4521 RepID=A0AAD8SX89_LOLMU|nr:hypothetical protein QYE76_054211 [Lolium multiflorum]KAK1666055.1 hypothetical protein QYE76_054214 [Lolium multiflorum]KAK1666058.1 hypothetical protein QYE76_054217 [Lolium multiflorum]KAK1666061.1 hypothetical protein QYE76_054220 [Lolium multiflorum]
MRLLCRFFSGSVVADLLQSEQDLVIDVSEISLASSFGFSPGISGSKVNKTKATIKLQLKKVLKLVFWVGATVPSKERQQDGEAELPGVVAFLYVSVVYKMSIWEAIMHANIASSCLRLHIWNHLGSSVVMIASFFNCPAQGKCLSDVNIVDLRVFP